MEQGTSNSESRTRIESITHQVNARTNLSLSESLTVLSIIFHDGQLVRHHRKGLRDRRRRHDRFTVNRKNAVERGQDQSPRLSPPHGLLRRTRRAVQPNPSSLFTYSGPLEFLVIIDRVHRRYRPIRRIHRTQHPSRPNPQHLRPSTPFCRLLDSP